MSFKGCELSAANCRTYAFINEAFAPRGELFIISGEVFPAGTLPVGPVYQRSQSQQYRRLDVPWNGDGRLLSEGPTGEPPFQPGAIV